MKKIWLGCINILLLITAFSCTNLLNEKVEQKKSSFGFVLSRSAIFKEKTEDVSLEDLRIDCTLAYDDKVINDTQELKKGINETNFNFTEIPLNVKILIHIEVYEREEGYDGEKPYIIEKLIYQGSTETVLENANENFITLSLKSAPIDYAQWGWEISGKKYEYEIKQAPKSSDELVLHLHYLRSKPGASEQIELSDTKFEIIHTPKNTPQSSQTYSVEGIYYMDLNPWDDRKFDNGVIVKCEQTEELREYLYSNPDMIASYTCEIPLKQLKLSLVEGDKISVQLKNATVTGSGIDNHIDLGKMSFSVVNSSAEWYPVIDATWDYLVNKASWKPYDFSKETDNYTATIPDTNGYFYLLEHVYQLREEPANGENIQLVLEYTRQNYGEPKKMIINNATVRIKKNNETWIEKNQVLDFTTGAWGARTENVGCEPNNKVLPEFGHYLADYANRANYSTEINLNELDLHKNDKVYIEIYSNEILFESEPFDLSADTDADNNPTYTNFQSYIKQSKNWKDLTGNKKLFCVQHEPLVALYKGFRNGDPIYAAYVAMTEGGTTRYRGKLLWPDTNDLEYLQWDLNDTNFVLSFDYKGDPRIATDGSNQLQVKVGENGSFEDFQIYEDDGKLKSNVKVGTDETATEFTLVYKNDNYTTVQGGATKLEDLLIDLSINKNYALRIGDLVFQTDKVLPYSEDYTEEQWNEFISTHNSNDKPVAVIFKEKDIEEQYSKALGVGVKESIEPLAWAKNTTQGYTTLMEYMQCTPMKDGNPSFTVFDETEGSYWANNSYFNGLDSSSQIETITDFCSYDDYGNQTLLGNYPAFEYSFSYGQDYSYSYYSGSWGIPSIKELVDLSYCKDIVNTVLSYLGDKGQIIRVAEHGNELYYLSSSQCNNSYSQVCIFDFEDRYIASQDKDNISNPTYIRVIHEVPARNY